MNLINKIVFIFENQNYPRNLGICHIYIHNIFKSTNHYFSVYDNCFQDTTGLVSFIGTDIIRFNGVFKCFTWLLELPNTSYI